MKHIALEPLDEYKMQFSLNPTKHIENVNYIHFQKCFLKVSLKNSLNLI